MSTSAPVLLTSIPQDFYIESLNGQANYATFLETFPDTIYNKSVDSHLAAFVYALLGPAGAGLVTEGYLRERIQYEEGNLSSSLLDELYTGAMSFSRLISETYTLDTSAQLLPAAQRAAIETADASYRNRAILWLKALQAGGSALGISLAATSGLGQLVEAFPNWKTLADQQSDIPLDLPYYGQTTSMSEVVLLPRRAIGKNITQSFTLNNEPSGGYFSITIPTGAPYSFSYPQSITYNYTYGLYSYYTLTYNTQPSNLTVGQWVVINPSISRASSSSPTILGLSGITFAGTVVQIFNNSFVLQSLKYVTFVAWDATVNYTTSYSYIVIYNGYAWYPAAANTNSAPSLTNTNWTLVPVVLGGNQTGPIAFNATAQQVQTALQGLPTVRNNVSVTGGPLPDIPVNITFTGTLGNQNIGNIAINCSSPDYFSQIGSFVGSNYSALTSAIATTGFSGTVTTKTSDASVDSQTAIFAPGDLQSMLTAVDVVRPQTTFVTVAPGQSLYQRQPFNASYSDSNYTDVVQYVTGNTNISWPLIDGNANWIQAGVEHEAPRLHQTYSSQYTNFHNIASVIAYNQNALNNANYSTMPTTNGMPFYAQYFGSHTGVFNQAQQALYPMLAQYQNSSFIFQPSYAVAATPNRLLITGSTSDNIALINDSYPISYFNLPGINALPTGNGPFWASDEAIVGNTDYLEIDLGNTFAVNFIYFEATNKPYSISVAYDILDQSPTRSFQAATISTKMPAVTSLNYSASATNPWTTVYLPITNPLGSMIYTRYIRLGFTRTASGQPFFIPPNLNIPYSIEVRNLRVGRIVNSTGVTSTTFV